MKIREVLASKMTFEEIEDLAAENKPLPKNTLFDDQCAFLSLRSLYLSWRGGHIERAQAQEERRRIKIAYEKRKELLKFYSDAYRHNQDNIRRSEATRAKILRNLKAGNDVLPDALICIGYMTNDASFISTVKKYLCVESENNAGDKADSKAG